MQKDTALMKSAEKILSETQIFNIKMIDAHFKSKQNQFLHLDTGTILSAPLYILLDHVQVKCSNDTHIKMLNLPSQSHKIEKFSQQYHRLSHLQLLQRSRSHR